MRSNFSPVLKMLEGFKNRDSTSDGRADERPLRRIDPLRPEVFKDISITNEYLGLADTLRIRRSTLAYSNEPIPVKPVFASYQEALRQDDKIWGEAADQMDLEGFAFVINPSDVQKGIYRVGEDTIDFISEFPSELEIESLSIQKEFARSSVILSVAANLDQADTYAGCHGYRLDMVRSAGIIYDTYLHNFANGLVGTPFAGFIPASVRLILSSDGVSRHQMFAATVAKPL